MTVIKAYTDIKQSKKLAEILPLESADMSWVSNGLGKPFARTIPIKGDPEELCACWSLAALLSILPQPHLERFDKDTWICSVFNKDNHFIDNASKNDPVDVCCEMIIKLHEEFKMAISWIAQAQEQPHEFKTL